MTRSVEAFRQVERRIDRGKTRERSVAQQEHFAAVAKTTADGVLGGYKEELQPDLAEAVIREFAARLKAMKDGACVSGLIGRISNELCADIEGPKPAARRAADKYFTSCGSDD